MVVVVKYAAIEGLSRIDFMPKWWTTVQYIRTDRL
jgi:hypothetical protein